MNKKIIVALDLDNINKAVKLVEELKKEAYAFKIGTSGSIETIKRQ